MRIDQTTLSELGLYSQTIDTVSKPSQRGRNIQGRRAVGDTMQLIIEKVKASPKPMTRLEIARALERSKTPHLVALIIELADSGQIIEHVRHRANGMLEYSYWGR